MLWLHAISVLSLVAWQQVSATSFLNHSQLLSGVENPAWFKHNIPFIDIPDNDIQRVYYYRWQTYKEHLVYTGAQYGYMASEFLQPVGYGAPYGGIVAAAGHHITEGRWIRDQKYGNDVVNYWLAGPGQFSKPAEDNVNEDTFDWAHEYSFWAASALWRQYLVTGDRDFVTGHVDNLIKQYGNWENHYNSTLGLYWQAPVWDASELTAASLESSDPYHGGYGYRPTINSYQYGDARAISAIAALKGDYVVAEKFAKRATALRNSVQSLLWDHKREFFMHMARDNNSAHQLLTTREIMGFVPWMFHLPSPESTTAFAQLTDRNGFAAIYGPTTTERRSKWFMYKAHTGCCYWDGPSWPFATSQTLNAVENVLHDYPKQLHITAGNYFSLLKQYAATQYKNGKPYVAEAHDPDVDNWMYDGTNHSEDYNHSTFVDNVIAGLLGFRAQPDNTLVVNPLVPSHWDHFALENVAYHGHDVTVIWDKNGSHYGQGVGLKVYIDSRIAGSRNDLGKLKINIAPAFKKPVGNDVNIAANGQRFVQGTTAFASYTSPFDNVWRAIDGIVWRSDIPENTRWTSYGSPNKSDYYGVDLRRNQSVSDVRLFFYDDGGGVRLPASYDLQYLTSGNKWATIPRQQRNVSSTTSNAETKITFPPILTSKLRVLAPNPGFGKGWGLSEFEVWTRAIFQIENANSGLLLMVDELCQHSGSTIHQGEQDGSRAHLWRFIASSGGWYKIRNLYSGLLLALDNSSPDDRLWRVESNSDGLYLIRNKKSGLVLGVQGASKQDGANIMQMGDNGAEQHLWSLLPSVPEA